MLVKQLIVAAAVAVLVLPPARADGQEANRTVQDILSFLVTNQSVQTSDFDKDREAAEATRDTLTRALLSSVATQPIGTSSSGFTYRFNPTLGTAERASETFGPFFVERALTTGAGHASFGFTFQYTSFQSLDGNDLKNGQFVTIANQFRDEAQPFDVETLTLNIRTRTATFYGNVGITNRVDVGVAVPVVQLSIDGHRDNTYRGRSFLLARASAKTTGLADIAVRSKVRLTGDDLPGAVALGVELRLPTGREENLLGAGETALRLSGLASREMGRASIHGDFTYGMGGIGREFSFGGAVNVAAMTRLTLVGEVFARRIDGVRRVTEVVAPHPRIGGVDTTRLVPMGDNETTSFMATGFKWNVGGTWLLHGNVMWSLQQNGLTARITPAVAMDYSWTR
jgi:hypothetical protein